MICNSCILRTYEGPNLIRYNPWYNTRSPVPFLLIPTHLPCGKATEHDTWLVPVGQLKASGRWANPRWFAHDLEGVVIPEMIHIQHARLF